MREKNNCNDRKHDTHWLHIFFLPRFPSIEEVEKKEVILMLIIYTEKGEEIFYDVTAGIFLFFRLMVHVDVANCTSVSVCSFVTVVLGMFSKNGKETGKKLKSLIGSCMCFALCVCVGCLCCLCMCIFLSV